jgi:hypothetical protein
MVMRLSSRRQYEQELARRINRHRSLATAHIWEGGWAVLRGPVLGAATAECEQRLNARI